MYLSFLHKILLMILRGVACIEWLVNGQFCCIWIGAKNTLPVFTASIFPNIFTLTSEGFLSEALSSFLCETIIEFQSDFMHAYMKANYSHLVFLQCYLLIPVHYHSSCTWHNNNPSVIYIHKQINKSLSILMTIRALDQEQLMCMYTRLHCTGTVCSKYAVGCRIHHSSRLR